jgi:uncharacterized protein YukE
MDHMILVGSEDVVRGASSMRKAAEEMQHAAGRIEAALERHAQRMSEISDEWIDLLDRLKAAQQETS